MYSLAEIERNVDILVDNTGEHIDKKIRHIVVALRFAGFNTAASCEGHLDHGFPYPWVDIAYDDKRLSRNEKKRLKKLLKQFYKNRHSRHRLLILPFADYRIQSVRWPRGLRKRKNHVDSTDGTLLSRYQDEMDGFADFLITITRNNS